jgi:hypothetical protein
MYANTCYGITLYYYILAILLVIVLPSYLTNSLYSIISTILVSNSLFLFIY